MPNEPSSTNSSKAQMPLGAQISHMLWDRGVRHIFGIPGVHNQEMYRGIEQAGLTHILARSPATSRARALWPMAMRGPPASRGWLT